MNHIHKKRIIYLLIFSIGLSLAAFLILYALNQNINVFLTPSQLQAINNDYHIRLGGMVKTGSVLHDKETLGVHFVVTDLKKEIVVNYVGVLPDLFREGKGVVVEGSLDGRGQFIATRVLAKHDENYMPKNVYQKLRENAG